ncbi:MAG: hypothetical protein ACI4U2_01410 [Christensenellaceae bacterium]
MVLSTLEQRYNGSDQHGGENGDKYLVNYQIAIDEGVLFAVWFHINSFLFVM